MESEGQGDGVHMGLKCLGGARAFMLALLIHPATHTTQQQAPLLFVRGKTEPEQGRGQAGSATGNSRAECYGM